VPASRLADAPALQAAKLALLSGSSEEASAVADALIARSLPLESDADCAAARALAVRAGRPAAVAAAVTRRWARECLARGLPGSALLWALRLGDAREVGLVADWLARALDAALDEHVLSLVGAGGAGGAGGTGGAGGGELFAPLPFALLARALRAADAAAGVVDAALECCGHRFTPLDGAALAPVSAAAALLGREPRLTRVRHARSALALLAEAAEACAGLGRGAGAAHRCAIDTARAAPLMRAAASHLALLVGGGIVGGGESGGEGGSGAAGLDDARAAGRLLRLALACGLLHAGVRGENLRGDDVPDEDTARMPTPLAEAHADALLLRAELEGAEALGVADPREMAALRRALGSCVARARRYAARAE
jgi:hypothetical protein